MPTWIVRSGAFWSAGTSGSEVAGIVVAYRSSAPTIGRATRPIVRRWYLRSKKR
jgi:hypothetical protein